MNPFLCALWIALVGHAMGFFGRMIHRPTFRLPSKNSKIRSMGNRWEPCRGNPSAINFRKCALDQTKSDAIWDTLNSMKAHKSFHAFQIYFHSAVDLLWPRINRGSFSRADLNSSNSFHIFFMVSSTKTRRRFVFAGMLSALLSGHGQLATKAPGMGRM